MDEAKPAGLAVDSHHNFYRVRESAEVQKFESFGDLEIIDGGPATGLAVDPSDNDLFVAHSTEVVGYNSIGKRLEGFGPPEIGKGAGIAVGPAHTIYVTDAAHQRIDVFAAVPGLALLTSLAGTGSGGVTSTPSGIDCGATCTGEFPEGVKVTLHATPTERSTFTGWTLAGHPGACPGTGSCEVEMSEAQSVKAEFTAITQEKLTVTNPGAGLGGGTVTGSSPGSEFSAIECGNGVTTCEAEYNKGADITLDATPTERSTFAGWTLAGHPGACPGTGSCEVEMSEAQSVKAEFTAITQEKLTVSSEGQGTVTTSPPAEFTSIDCGSGHTTCEAEYNEGATVVLTANPVAGNHFSAWGVGDCESQSGNECTVTMSSAQSATAIFATTFQTLRVTRSGLGEVISSPAGIACGEDLCEAEFPESSTVVLTAHPAPHNRSSLGVRAVRRRAHPYRM